MPVTKLRPIPEPDPKIRSILVWAGDPGLFVSFLRGNGDSTYACGVCGRVLVERIFHGQVRNLVFKCPKCGTFNEVP
jgi:predicted RNA-binding Zn-ribbon protein involved in translation (DUF1610 family)